MKRRVVAFLLATPLSSLAAAAKLAAGLVNPGYEDKPAWFKNSLLDLREDIREAAAQRKRLMVYFYQDGCPYCTRLLADNFGQREIADKTRAYFDVVAINLWGDLEVVDAAGHTTTEKLLGRELKVQFTPTLLMFDEDARVVLRLNGYRPPHEFSAALDYAGQRLERRLTFAEHRARAAPPPAHGKLHDEPGAIGPPYRLADALERNRKPLLVIFEQAMCSGCDELHQDILQRAETRALLARLQLTVLDQHSKEPLQTPDGATRSTREWARSIGVHYAPSLVFFDRQGREVFRSEGYLKAFHVQSMLDYVASGAYLGEPQFQRYIERRRDALRRQGRRVELME